MAFYSNCPWAGSLVHRLVVTSRRKPGRYWRLMWKRIQLSRWGRGPDLKWIFLSSDGAGVITARWIIHLGADSCYYNDYLYLCYQRVIIIIMTVIGIGVVVASRTRIKQQARPLSPGKKNKHALMTFALRAGSNHVSLIEQYRGHTM